MKCSAKICRRIIRQNRRKRARLTVKRIFHALNAVNMVELHQVKFTSKLLGDGTEHRRRIQRVAKFTFADHAGQAFQN
jgi:hypothetical protein